MLRLTNRDVIGCSELDAVRGGGVLHAAGALQHRQLEQPGDGDRRSMVAGPEDALGDVRLPGRRLQPCPTCRWGRRTG
jgi:hypothetical protein